MSAAEAGCAATAAIASTAATRSVFMACAVFPIGSLAIQNTGDGESTARPQCLKSHHLGQNCQWTAALGGRAIPGKGRVTTLESIQKIESVAGTRRFRKIYTGSV